MNAPFLRPGTDGVYLAIKLQPRASRQQISGIHGTELKVSVTPPPVDSAANHALIEFIADLLEISSSHVQLVKGQTSRHKILLVRNLSPDQILACLQPHLAS